MAEPGPERPSPADLEAAIAALPAKKEALREAFDRLVACSPYPLPFTLEDIDAHLSGIQSSISRRFRQVQVPEAARQARTVPASAEARSCENQEEEEEVEEIKVEEEEEDDENENDDEEDEEGEGDEEEEEEEEEEEDGEEEEEEVEEDVEEEVEEAEDAAMDEREQEADEEMQLTNVDEQNAKEEPEASGEEPVTKKIKVAEEETSKEVPDKSEEPDAEEKEESPATEPGTKSANKASLKKVMMQNQIEQAPTCGSKDLMAVCASMDANKLDRFICGRDTSLGGYLPTAMRCAPDAAALVLQVVKPFLSDKRFKATKVWNRCIGLISCVSATASKPSANTIEQAKQVAKDWKEMTDKLECPGDHHMLGAWGLLHFITSYNIVSEFDTSKIIRLFGMVPRHMQKKNTIELCKGLGISDRITDLIDYLIGKGQHLDVFHLANVFNLSDKYPLLSLLKGYIETAKQTSMEIQNKSLISAIPKEITNRTSSS